MPESTTDPGEGTRNRPRGPADPGDFDPDTVPVRPAATVLILDERPDLQVLMLKRNARSIFVGDMWVFPGGAVDEEDATPEADAAVENRTDTEASEMLDLPSGGIAYWVAALRETFEEAGILFAHRPDSDTLVDLSPPDVADRFDAHRDGVNSGDVDFVNMVRAEGLVLDGRGVHYVSRWITPHGSPRRYDARFFVTAMPAGQVPLHDDDEAVHHEWMSATDALAAYERDEMAMMTPTVTMLHRLAQFSSVEAAMASAAATRSNGDDDEYIRIRMGIEGLARIAFPGDPDYGDADAKVEHGMLRWPISR